MYSTVEQIENGKGPRCEISGDICRVRIGHVPFFLLSCLLNGDDESSWIFQEWIWACRPSAESMMAIVYLAV